jgi:anti-anti-sigma factor
MFRLTSRRLPPALLVEVTGEVDVTAASDFTRAVNDLAGPVVLELSGLSYVDSAGFAALDQLLSHPAKVAVIGPDSAIRTAANLVGLPYHDSVDDAARAVAIF